MRYFMSVPKGDPTALYLCHPFAVVKRSQGSEYAVELSVTKEVHQWLPCCESTNADELLHGLDSDSEDEDGAGGGEMQHSNGNQATQYATNIKCEVDVAWDVSGGPVVTGDEAAASLCAMLQAVEEEMSAKQQPKLQKPPGSKSAAGQPQVKSCSTCPCKH